MSSVCVLTPIVVASWPIVSSAVFSAAAAMGFSIVTANASGIDEAALRNRVDLDVANSDVVAEQMSVRQSITIRREGIEITISTSESGVLSVCASGDATKSRLRAVGEEVAGRVVQQFAYNKLMTELGARGFRVVDEAVAADHSIQIRVTSR